LFSIEDLIEVTVRVKHDGSNFLAAYSYNYMREADLCFPELCFDTENDKSESWQPDDWWFHVSGTDCEAQGTYSVREDCNVIQSDWQGVPNFAMIPDPPPVDTFEIRIPFSRINIEMGDTVGIGFDVEYVPMQYGFWPGTMSLDSPATWGTAVIKP
jgi:hypothetical protein